MHAHHQDGQKYIFLPPSCAGHKLGQSFICSEDAPFVKRKQEIRIYCLPKYIGCVGMRSGVAGVLLEGKLGVPNQKEVPHTSFLLFFPHGKGKTSKYGWETEVVRVRTDRGGEGEAWATFTVCFWKSRLVSKVGTKILDPEKPRLVEEICSGCNVHSNIPVPWPQHRTAVGVCRKTLSFLWYSPTILPPSPWWFVPLCERAWHRAQSKTFHCSLLCLAF